MNGAELERLNATLFEDSRRDHLTGLGNRKRLDEDLAQWTARAVRYGDIFAIALFDIDNFKGYNDTFGPSPATRFSALCGRHPSASLSAR